MRRLLVIVLLALPAAAESLAESFKAAYDRGDRNAMATLAGRPAKEVEYTLAVWRLLSRGQPDAARALAEARNGPEREGLQRLVEVYRSPSAEQRRALAAANGKKGAQALEAVRRLPTDEGTVLAVEVTWIRAHALLAMKKHAEAAREFARCARFARDCGWLKRCAAAWGNSFRLGPTLEAADGLVKATGDLDDRKGLLRALGARAGLRIAKGKLRSAREDYVRGIAIAKQLGAGLIEGHMLSQLGFVFHRHERKPREGLKWYRKALPLLRPQKNEGPLLYCLFNTAVAFSEAGAYAEALAHLDELLQHEVSDVLSNDALTQRAYVLRRQGRLEKSLAAYRKLFEAAPHAGMRLRLHADLGELQLERGDFREAERHFEVLLEGRPEFARALAGRAAARGGRGEVALARADFDAATRHARDATERLRILMARMAYERSWGAVSDARNFARDAVQALQGLHESEYGNAAVLWYVLADLLLLDGEYEKAAPVLAQASKFFERLKDPHRAIPAYARETLVAIRNNKPAEADQRLGSLRARAGSTPGDGLKSMAKCVEAMFARKGGRTKEAIRLFAEAEALAIKADDAERLATALAHHALLEPERGHALALAALEALDSRPERAPSAQPFIEGEHPFLAASIGVRALLLATDPDGGKAYALVERVRNDRLLLALRGRDALLAATLPDDEHRTYVAARGRLKEARAEKEGVAAAARALRELAERLHELAPLALPRVPPLAEVQRALGEDEALLLMLADEYVTATVVVDRKGVVVAEHDPRDPLAAVAEAVRGKKRLLVALDGAMSIDAVPWEKGKALDAFDIRYVNSASGFLRQRRTAGAASGIASIGPVPAEFAARVAVLAGPNPVRMDLRHPQASSARPGPPVGAATVVVVRTRLERGPRVEGIGAVAAALHRRGAGEVVISLSGTPPAPLLALFFRNLLDRKMSAAVALREAKLWARGEGGLEDPRRWGDLVFYGAR